MASVLSKEVCSLKSVSEEWHLEKPCCEMREVEKSNSKQRNSDMKISLKGTNVNKGSKQVFSFGDKMK